jgi:hypothetical protein
LMKQSSENESKENKGMVHPLPYKLFISH